MKTILYSLMLLFSGMIVNAKITVVDEKPIAGKLLICNLEDERIIDNSKISVVVYLYRTGSDAPKYLEQESVLNNYNKTMALQLQIPDSTEFAIIKYFANSKYGIITSQLPVMMYDKSGRAVRNSNYYASLYCTAAITGAENADIDYALSMEYLQKELQAYPNHFMAYLNKISIKYDQKNIDSKAADSLGKNLLARINDLNEIETQALAKYFSSIGNNPLSDSLKQVLIKKYPVGMLSEEKFISTLSEKKDNEFMNLADIFIKQFPNSKQKTNILEKMVQYYISNQKYDRAESIMQQNNFVPPASAIRLAFMYAEKLRDMPRAEALLTKISNKIKSISYADCPDNKSKYEWSSQNTDYLAEVYRASGEFYLQNKNKEKSIENFILAKAAFREMPDKLYENIALANYIFRLDPEAFAASEDAILNSVETPKVLDINKKLYSKYGKAMAYDKYLDSIRLIAENRRFDKIKANMINRPIALPALANIDELMIDLSIFKGEVLVVEFFASWCQPCQSSIESLVDLSNSLSENAGVQMLGINTWENDKLDKSLFKNNDFGRVKVFFDESGNFAKKVGVQGLPARLYIDKNMKLRYIQTGAIGKSEDIRETKDIIGVLINE